MLEDDFLDGEVMMSLRCEGEYENMKEEAWKFVDLDYFETLDGLVLQRQRSLIL